MTEAETVCNQGHPRRPVLPASLLKAKAYYQLNNLDACKQEILKIDEDTSSLEKDFLHALYEYSKQAYKQFYLSTMGLVAACQQILMQDVPDKDITASA